jgi:hypothetical protein
MGTQYLFYVIFLLHAIILLFLCLISQQSINLNTIFCNDVSNNNYFIDNHIINEFYLDVKSSKVNFEFSEDIFAILHIQKTNSFDWQTHFWQHLKIKLDGKKEWINACLLWDNEHYSCYKNKINKPIIWSQETNRHCDIHADYSELTYCLAIFYKYRLPSALGIIMNGVAHILVFLKDPITRYLSEYDEIKKGKIINYTFMIKTFINLRSYLVRCN